MAVLGLDEVLKRVKEENLVEDLSDRELTNPEGVGIDLRLGAVHKIVEGGAFIEADGPEQLGLRKGIQTELIKRYDPKSKEQPFVELLPEEYYLVETVEKLNTPEDLMPVLYPRGSLFKAGILLLCSKADPGYQGFLGFGLKNLSKFPVKLQLGARFCNVVFFKIEGSAVKYRGQHQGGRVSIKEEERQV
nr:dUTPase [uncultured bacterium]